MHLMWGVGMTSSHGPPWPLQLWSVPGESHADDMYNHQSNAYAAGPGINICLAVYQ